MSIEDRGALASTLTELDDEVSILNGWVVAYSYLGTDGQTAYGVTWGGDELALGVLGLTVVAQQHLFEANLEETE